MAITDAPSVPTIDGVPLTPKQVSLDGIPQFDNFEDERRHRKDRKSTRLNSSHRT